MNKKVEEKLLQLTLCFLPLSSRLAHYLKTAPLCPQMEVVELPSPAGAWLIVLMVMQVAGLVRLMKT